MRPVQKALTTMLWLCAVLAMVSVIGANMWRGKGAATGADIEELGETVRARVKANSGIELEWEIKRLGVAK